MIEPRLPRRMRSMETAKGWDEFRKQFTTYLQANNFSEFEVRLLIHAINSFYFMGADIENFSPPKDNLT